MDKLRIHPGDNVAVCLEKTGDVPAGHKMALQDIKKGENIIKYGFPIGRATEDIKKDSWVHSHNMKTNLEGLESYSYGPDFKELPKRTPATFSGFLRANGKVGVRNELWIIPTVGCVNGIARRLENEGNKLIGGSFEKTVAFPHPQGCSQCGQDLTNTQKILAGLARHPNAGAVLVLGLGCEVNHLEEFKKVLGPVDEERVRFLNCQDSPDEIEEGIRILKELSELLKKDQRSEQSVEKLVIGYKCGGSDGFSGITANPAVGNFSDKLLSMGGSAVLTEVPEMFGAERILMNRCRNEEVFEKTVQLINDFKSYFKSYGESISDNPSPGNKAGGITTLEEKSLGCIQKGGSAPVEDVLSYGDQVKKPGLNLLQAPGNDLVAATACAAAGAQIVLFTTGRGTPFACPVPTVKIATNEVLAKKKENWIDFDASEVLRGMTMDQAGENLIKLVLSLASGFSKTKSEEAGYSEMAIFKNGVTE